MYLKCILTRKHEDETDTEPWPQQYTHEHETTIYPNGKALCAPARLLLMNMKLMHESERLPVRPRACSS
jgi:hypothetical protein